MKIPRKIELKESKFFFITFMKFWEKHQKDFRHIDLEHLLFLKEENPPTQRLDKYMEIAELSVDLKRAVPGFYFSLTVFPDFDYINEVKRDFHFYNCLFRIPQNYKEKPVLKKPDFVGFYDVLYKFKAKQLLLYGRDV